MIDEGMRRGEAETARQGHGITVEVAAYRKGRVYRAVCLDLGLIVERPTLQAAIDELTQTMHGYVRDAIEAGLELRDILRPVPPSERRYVYYRLAFAAFKQFIASLVSVDRSRDGEASAETFTHTYCAV